MGGGGKVAYPKHVWSPSGGWYSQPANWRSNTAVMVGFILLCSGLAFSYSATHEQRHRYPALGRFYPSRYWSKDVIANDKKLKAQKSGQEDS